MSYLDLARRLPFREVMARGSRFLLRRGRQALSRLRDQVTCTFPRDPTIDLAEFADAVTKSGVERAVDQGLTERYAQHAFDLLGSGWVRNTRGMRCAGIEGVVFPQHHACATPPDAHGHWLLDIVSRANAPASAAVWQLISAGTYAHPGYEPIDWQIDMRSGWRWSERTHFTHIKIGPARGADIKMPWELSRMQHLVLIARSLHEVPTNDAPAREIRAQILDFIACNPPRFGVCWASPMEAALRGANWAVALRLAAAAGHLLDAPARKVIASSLEAHARHVLAHLEWAPEPRSNHYLANICGIIIIALHLAPSAETDRWLAFAVRELETELPRQFRIDGGNYEASTGYHRLSSELVLYALAAVRALPAERSTAIAAAGMRRLSVRPPQPGTALPLHTLSDGTMSLVSASNLKRVASALSFSLAVTRGDGRPVMIGDQDSACFFRPDPDVDSEGRIVSNDHRGLMAFAGVLFARPEWIAAAGRPRFDAALAHLLCSGRSFPPIRLDAPPSSGRLSPSSVSPTAGPAASRRFEIPLPHGATDGLICEGFPLFGLYIVRSARLHLTFRCFDPRGDGVWSHAHDDNLGLTLWIDGADIIGDPGTSNYTAFPELRELWRSATAHAVPRQNGQPAMRSRGPFAVEHLAHATCDAFGCAQLAGRLFCAGWAVMRHIVIEDRRIIVVDTASPGPLDYPCHAGTGITMTEGYGRKTERAVPLL